MRHSPQEPPTRGPDTEIACLLYTATVRLLSLVFLAASAFAGDGEARLAWKAGGRSRYASVRRTLESTLPDGVVVPEDAGEPWLGSWPFADKKLSLLFDAKTNILWVDTDGDASFTDEKPITFRQRYGTHVHAFKHAGIPVLIERRADDPASILRVTVLAHRVGTVVLEGRARRIEASDLDGDARPDLVHLDTDGDALLESAEAFAAKTPFLVRDRAYRAVFLEAGARVRFERAASAPPRPPERWITLRVPAPGRDSPTKRIDIEKAWEGAKKRPGYWAKYTLLRIADAGTPEAGKLLWRVFRTRRDENLKKAALEGLGYREYVVYAKRVGSVARTHKDPAFRTVALEALHRMEAPDRLRTFRLVLDRERDQGIALKAARYLAALGAPGRAELRDAAVRASHRPNRVHAYRFATRTSAKHPSREFVLSAARAGDPDLRAAGLRDAHGLRYPEAHALALEAATAPKMGRALRLAIIEDLASWSDVASTRAVLPLAVGAQPAARGRMIDLLRPVRDGATVAVLFQGLTEQRPAARALCADVLARMPVAADAVLVARLGEERNELVLIALMRACGTRRSPGAAYAIVTAARTRAKRSDVQAAALTALGRLGLDEQVAFDYVQERVRLSNWEERIAVLDTVAGTGNKRGAPLLAGALGDARWQVRLAAIQGLARLRAKSSIGPLIAQLAKEKTRRIRRALADTLHSITHRQLFDDAARWSAWWFDNKNKFVVPEKPPGAGKTRKGGRRTVAFYGIPVDSERIIFVIDQSGSMSAPLTSTGPDTYDNRLEKAKAETLKVVAKLNDRARINVVFFESEIHEWKKDTLAPLYGSTRRALAEHLKEPQPTGGTDLFGGLQRALETKHVDTIYLLSDGAPTNGLTNADDILDAVRKINRTRRITIHCVSVGRNAPLLRRLAEATGGKYVRR